MKTKVTSDMVGCLSVGSGILSSILVARHFDDSRSEIFPFDRSTGAQSLVYQIVRLFCLVALHGADTLYWHKWIYWPLDTGSVGKARILQDLDGILQWNKRCGEEGDCKSVFLSMSDESS